MIHPGEAATISAAVVIAHHKEPLRNLITHAHTVLKHEAKDKAGRDAIAVSLMKRSGGERKTAWKWGQSEGGFVERLLKASADLMDEKESSRLMYKIDENRTALETLHRSGPAGSVNKYIESLIEKGERDRNVKDEAFKAVKAERAERIASLIDFEKEKGVMNADALIIARFLAQTTGGYSNGDL
jgi:CRISPR-associated protein Cmr2